jgi:Putative beta-lactamase-inhibitor-like, PepSY-like
MIRFERAVAYPTLLASLAMAGAATAGEEKIPVKELPRAVLRAVEAKFPKAEIEGAAKEEEDGKTVYEVSLEVADRGVDVALTPDGTILEVEKEIPVDELPAAVKKALAKKYPKAKVAKAEAITKGEGGATEYEVVLASEVVVTAKGKFVESEDDEEEDDDKPKAKSKKKGEKEDDDKPKAKSKKKGEKEDEDDDEDDEKETKKGRKD